MKFLVLSFAIVWQLSGFTSRAVCQERNAQMGRLHFMFPFPERFKGRYELAASHAEVVHPNGGTESVLQLRGNAEASTIVCRPTGNICDKSPVILRADAIDYNETTGEIQAHGVVHTVLMQPSPDVRYKTSK